VDAAPDRLQGAPPQRHAGICGHWEFEEPRPDSRDPAVWSPVIHGLGASVEQQ